MTHSGQFFSFLPDNDFLQLYKGDEKYLTIINQKYSSSTNNMFSWDNKQAGYQTHLAQILNSEPYLRDAAIYAQTMMSAKKTPKGLT